MDLDFFEQTTEFFLKSGVEIQPSILNEIDMKRVNFTFAKKFNFEIGLKKLTIIE